MFGSQEFFKNKLYCEVKNCTPYKKFHLVPKEIFLAKREITEFSFQKMYKILTNMYLRIKYKWSHEIKRTFHEHKFVFSKINIQNCILWNWLLQKTANSFETWVWLLQKSTNCFQTFENFKLSPRLPNSKFQLNLHFSSSNLHKKTPKTLSHLQTNLYLHFTNTNNKLLSSCCAGNFTECDDKVWRGASVSRTTSVSWCAIIVGKEIGLWT